jgi:hypothetical protein
VQVGEIQGSVAPRWARKYSFLYTTKGAGMRTRSGHEPVVIVPLAEYESMKETEYLLGSPGNAEALRRSIAELDRGEGVERALIDPSAAQDVA